MGNSQSTENEHGNRRHSGSHQGSHTDGTATAAHGSLSHRLSRRSKGTTATTTTSATGTTTVPSIHVTGGSDGQQQPPNNHAMDMLSPVVGSPLPDTMMAIPGLGNSNRLGNVHVAVPETIPQTLPNQGGLAQIMGARMMAPGVEGR
ncbi:hypothetical protein LPJ57_008004, partial [Coemansia sp. RSA 486]